MNIAKYLKRINYTDKISVTDEVLKRLHQSHVYQVPFENFDIFYKKLFGLDIEKVYKKIIDDARGGFCYELNLLFSWLLAEIGFSSRIIACRIFNDDGSLGPEFDHMAIYVKTEKEFLLDVGYGDLFITPIEIKIGVQHDGRNYFRIENWNKNKYLISMSPDGVDFSRRYVFSLDLVKVDDFTSICLDKQINPNSYFVKNVICTKPTNTGRFTIFNEKIIERKGSSKIEFPIENEDILIRFLKEKFQIELK
jgi:N-hydroxyarylamine O-acetyltransferase